MASSGCLNSHATAIKQPARLPPPSLVAGRVTFHHHEVVGAAMARDRLSALRFTSAVVSDVSGLVALHLRFHGYGEAGWTDSAVRRYVRDAGPLLTRLHVLARADCTTRNKAKALRLERAYADLERRVKALSAQEELDKFRPGLNGTEIMEVLGIPPGPVAAGAVRSTCVSGPLRLLLRVTWLLSLRLAASSPSLNLPGGSGPAWLAGTGPPSYCSSTTPRPGPARAWRPWTWSASALTGARTGPASGRPRRRTRVTPGCNGGWPLTGTRSPAGPQAGSLGVTAITADCSWRRATWFAPGAPEAASVPRPRDGESALWRSARVAAGGPPAARRPAEPAPPAGALAACAAVCVAVIAAVMAGRDVTA